MCNMSIAACLMWVQKYTFLRLKIPDLVEKMLSTIELLLCAFSAFTLFHSILNPAPIEVARKGILTSSCYLATMIKMKRG